MPQHAGARNRVKLTDIAQACGVSRATVSLVLRNSPLVKAGTRTKVEEELKRQGYVYNRGAANLRRQTSSSVALVINDLSNPFFAEFATGVDEELALAGYVTLLGSTAESVERQRVVLSSMMEHGPAGLILSPAEGSDGAELKRLLGPEPAVLVFNRELDGTGWDFLVCDNRVGARLATQHLIDIGHRRIAFFGGHASSSSCHQRRMGYADALAGAGIKPDKHSMVECTPSRLQAAASTNQLFAGPHAPTAAVCYNDAVALGLLHGLAARGLRAGRNFAVTGFDDIPESAVSSPPLTTVAVEPRTVGRLAANLILQRAGHPQTPPARTVAPVRLVVRVSSNAPLPGNAT